MTISSGMYTKHYYNGGSRVASRVGGGFGQHNDLNNYQPLVDHVPLQNANDYAYKSQELRTVWSRNAGCAGLQDQLEYSYAFEMGDQFTNQQPDGERYFYHSDHLGSSAYITTENGYATQFLAYQPFGETLAEQQNSTGYYSPFKFSAKEKDLETGYSYFGARYYSPELSVWLGVDPMSDERPSLSPYNYCQWNPVRLIDPTGMLDEEAGSYEASHNKVGGSHERTLDDRRPRNLPATQREHDSNIGRTPMIAGNGDEEKSKPKKSNISPPLVLPAPAPALPWELPLLGGYLGWHLGLGMGLEIEKTAEGLARLLESLGVPSSYLRGYTPAPKELKGFPGAVRDGHAAGRARWRTADGDILEWDGQHGEIEKYNRQGKHQGVYNPQTGELTKPPVKGRTTRN